MSGAAAAAAERQKRSFVQLQVDENSARAAWHHDPKFMIFQDKKQVPKRFESQHFLLLTAQKSLLCVQSWFFTYFTKIVNIPHCAKNRSEKEETKPNQFPATCC